MRHDEELALHVTALLACACSALVFEAVIGLILVLAWLFAGVYMVVDDCGVGKLLAGFCCIYGAGVAAPHGTAPTTVVDQNVDLHLHVARFSRP